MTKNKKFFGYTLWIAILGLLANFLYSGLQNDHMNILATALADKWSQSQIYMGANLGGYAIVILYAVFGAGLIRFGCKKMMVPTIGVLGVATALLGWIADGDNFILYTAVLFIVRCCVIALQMGFFQLCANWFIKYRGRMLGIITIGSPFFSVVGINFLGIITRGGLTVGYVILGGIVIVMAIVLALVMKDRPEHVGLFPDGADIAPKSEAGEEGFEDINMTLGEVLKEGRAWKLIISYGILQGVIAAMMGTMAMRYVMAGSGFGPGTAPMTYLSIGALLGIPMSYVLGWIDDKVGSIKASVILNLLYFVCVIPFVIMPWDMTTGASPVLMLCWAFGVACMTGGCPTMHPCVTSYVYGRRRYQAANKWIMAVQGLILAFFIPVMNVLYDMSMPNESHGPLMYAKYGYIGLVVLLVISLVILISMHNIPDANLEDREYAKK